MSFIAIQIAAGTLSSEYVLCVYMCGYVCLCLNVCDRYPGKSLNGIKSES